MPCFVAAGIGRQGEAHHKFGAVLVVNGLDIRRGQDGLVRRW